MINICELIHLFVDKPKINKFEDFEKVEIMVTTKTINIPQKDELIHCISRFEERDKITIDIALDEMDPISFSNIQDNVNYNNFLSELKNILDIDLDDDSQYNILIRIYKQIDEFNQLTIYYLDIFTEFLKKLSLKGLFYSFKNILLNRNYIKFKLHDTDDMFHTSSLYFLPKGGDKEVVYENRQKIIERRNMISSFLNATEYNFIPEDFYLIKRSKNEKINIIMDKLAIVSSLIFISNISNLCNDNKFKCRLEGYKMIENTISFNDIDIKIDSLTEYINIYKWIYYGGNLSDKVGLARNIISLHLKDCDLLTLKNNTLGSIISSHEIYLKQNIQQYIEVKNKMTEILFDMSRKSSKMVENFTSSFKGNIFTFISFFATVLVMNSIYSGKLENIFTRDIAVISYALILGSFAFLIYSIIEKIIELQRFTKTYNRLKESYYDILEPDDIEKIFHSDKYHNEDKKYVKDKIKLYSIVWMSIIVIIYGMIVYLSNYDMVDIIKELLLVNKK